MNPDQKIPELLSRFQGPDGFQQAQVQGGGLINANWQVTDAAGERFLLQRLNGRVFPDPEPIMRNILRVTGHLRQAGETTLDFLPLQESSGAHLHRDENGQAWRLCRFIAGTSPADRPDHPDHSEHPDKLRLAGRAYGRFLAKLADFPVDTLNITLPGFHDTAARWAALLQAHHDDVCGRADEVADEMAALWERGDLGQGLARLDLPPRVTHNDAKLANVLLGENPDRPGVVVDLDTVMPGTALHDFGDMMRTMCCGADEEETDLQLVAVDPSRLEALAAGWLGEADPVLLPVERLNLLPAGLIITFEQAARFLTDYLQGDVYYHTTRPGQNLDRCRNQLQLLASMVDQREDLAAVLP